MHHVIIETQVLSVLILISKKRVYKASQAKSFLSVLWIEKSEKHLQMF